MTGLPEPTSADGDEQRAGAATYLIRTLIVIAALVVVVVVGGIVRRQFLSTDQLFDLTQEALGEQPQPDFDSAEGYLLRILDREPDSNQANLMLAAVYAQTERFDEALERVERIPDDGSREAVQGRCLAGEVLLNHHHQPSVALEQFQRAFHQDRNSATAVSYLAHLHRLACRTWDQTPYSVLLGKNASLQPQQLVELVLGHELHTIPALIDVYRAAAPDDPIVLLGDADIAMQAGDLGQAEQLYRRVIAEHPEILAAHVRLGEVLLQAVDAEEFYTWNSGLPERAGEHPLTWSIRGAWAEDVGQTDIAIRCYWESVRIDPNNLPALYRLGRLLVAEGRMEDARPFLFRAHLLEIYHQEARSLILPTDREAPNLGGYFSAALLSGDLGLYAESNAWIQLILQVDSEIQDAVQADRNLQDLLLQLTDQRTARDLNPAVLVDLSEFPLPDWVPGSAPVPADFETTPAPAVTFQDQAGAAGVEFTYVSGGDPDVPGLNRLYQFTGGGAAVLDLDCDGWPDVHLTQGADSPEQLDPAAHVDCLYRNTGEGRFAEVAGSARIVEERYSQGAAVGDFNGDGFPDLRVANIGGNRLYQNNGDGTFEDVSETAGLAGSAWTTSCLLADLNGDGLPDLYDVNFLAGPEALTTVCRDAEGVHHACAPIQFSAAADELFLNRGDGTFENVTALSGIQAPNGRGLAIVAADLSGQGQLDLFVANSGSANFCFVNETQDAGGVPRFTDQAVPLGAAYNRHGRARSSMGIAAGGANQWGRPDLFVTTSRNETSTLYRVDGEGLFSDEAPSAGLAEAGERMFGAGAQFIDGAVRGALDLIVVNGHVNANEDAGVPRELRPQYFSSVGGGRFEEQAPASLGPYFESDHLGRALARIDWNRDGREDLVIINLDSPAALLTNTTRQAGRFIGIRLVGRQSARDAIGAMVTLLTSDGRVLRRQLTAGDGFQASNQRTLIFGLGETASVDTLEVRWPSGLQQRFGETAREREYMCVEGSDRLYEVAR